jgi:hypothetical protein
MLNEDLTKISEINFTNNLFFKRDVFDFIIEETKNEPKINNFFSSKISNILAFVGKNGIGKTTNVCKPIMTNNWLKFDFIIFKNNDELLVFKNPIHKSIGIKNKTRFKYKEIIISDLTINDGPSEVNSKSNDEFNDLTRIYYSSSFSDLTFETRSILDDISSRGLLTKELQKINAEEKTFKDFSNDSFTRFKLNDLKWQIKFLESEVGKEVSKSLSLNPRIVITHFPKVFVPMQYRVKDIKIFDDLQKYFLEKRTRNGFIDITSLPKTPRIILLLWSIVCNLPDNIQTEFIEFLRREQFDFKGDKFFLNPKISNLNVFIEPLYDLIIPNLEHIEDHFIEYQNDMILLSRQSFSIPIELANSFIEFYYRTFEREKTIYKYLFNWTISTGEYSYLSLFSRLYNHEKRLANTFFLLVIDEGDSNFHPEWSRGYIDILNKWIPKILSRAKGIQIILTTHSPYVLSDLPASNVFILNRENGDLVIRNNNRQTFGANIHDLLANEFFLEDGFIGAFAKNKIQVVIDNLRTDKDFVPETKMEQEDIKKVIDVIGEPFLKEKLLEMYQQKFNEPDFYDKEIERLQLKIEEYKKRQKTKE